MLFTRYIIKTSFRGLTIHDTRSGQHSQEIDKSHFLYFQDLFVHADLAVRLDRKKKQGDNDFEEDNSKI